MASPEVNTYDKMMKNPSVNTLTNFLFYLIVQNGSIGHYDVFPAICNNQIKIPKNGLVKR
jgi:hypothetical protein